jgi:hypothetical protein
MDGLKTLALKTLLKSWVSQYGPTLVLLLFTVTIPLVMGIRQYSAAQAIPAPVATAPQTVDLSRLVELLAQRQTPAPLPPAPLPMEIIPQRQATPPRPAEGLQTALQPIPDPLILAIERLGHADSLILQKLAALEGRLNTSQASNAAGTAAQVDRSGNTPAALDDIYSDVNVPVLPDPLAKGMAKHPGAVPMIEPETGIPVLANTVWIRTHGGRVLQLKRHNGVERPVTIEYRAPEKAAPPEPAPAPFRISN